MNNVSLKRRGCLALLAASSTVATAVPGPAAAAPKRSAVLPRWRSNGWDAIQRPVVAVVEGSNLRLSTAPGAPAVILAHLLRRWLYEIDDSVLPSELVGHVPPSRRADRADRLHSTGTALAIRPGWYPPGSVDRLPARDVVVVRDILAELRGVVRWGADVTPHDDARFVLDRPPGHPDLRSVAEALRRGTGPDLVSADLALPFTPTRRALARATARRSTS